MIASHRFAKSGTVSRLHRWTGTVLAAGALGVAAVAGAGTAAALSSEDDMFLSEISADGIAYDTPRPRSAPHTTSARGWTGAPTPSTSVWRSSTTPT